MTASGPVKPARQLGSEILGCLGTRLRHVPLITSMHAALVILSTVGGLTFLGMWSNCVAAVPSIHLHATACERVFEQDPRLYRLVIRNGGAEPCHIRYLLIADQQGSRSVSADDPLVLWWRTVPRVIAPGAYGQVMIKLSEPNTDLAACRIIDDRGATVTAALPQQPGSIQLDAVRFNTIEKEVCLYWHHRAEGPLKLKECWIDGKRCPLPADADAPVPPRTVRCQVLPGMDHRIGRTHLLSLRFEDGQSLDEIVRIPPPFAFGLEEGADLWSGTRLWTPAGGDMAPAPVAYLRSCLTHAPGSIQGNAWDALRAMKLAQSTDPTTLSTIHLCRHRQDEGIWWFSRLADGMRIGIDVFDTAPGVAVSLAENGRLLDLAQAAAGHAPVYALISLSSAGDPLVWRRTLLAMAHGCAGVHFRLERGVDQPKALEWLRNLLQPLRSTDDLWSSAQAHGHIATPDDHVSVQLIQLGSRRMALIAIDQRLQAPQRDLVVDFSLPGELRAEKATRVGEQHVELYQHRPQHMSLAIRAFTDAAIVFLDLSANGAGK